VKSDGKLKKKLIIKEILIIRVTVELTPQNHALKKLA
jgi:hypothetical protein